MNRRVFAWVAAGSLLALARPASAGTYLNRAVVLLLGATREASYLKARVSDRELAAVVYRMAQARLAAAGSMTVPKEVVNAHPHLLLVLESYAQACEGATRGDLDRFTTYYQRALDEDRTFRAVLKSLGWVLPDA